RPAGLLHNITPLTPSTGGTGQNKTDALGDDLQALLAAVAPVAGNSEIIIVASPAQAVGINVRMMGRLTYNVLASRQLGSKTVICFALNSIVSATGDVPLIDVTRTASTQMSDSPTADLMTGGSVRALFQSDTVGLRLRWPISWSLRDPRGLA